ncbi:hypothetical protein Acor_55130 [Acrocarpospora corrugata]|uniref:Nucleotide exchange factor GrpE n=1 Tax=Acrocarpospora corrugata TaxID=35763 RepID=A0A5M3W2Z7_9ACTN|nr:nucleotide exchange factor GrpE [Acrocarpospora corrugata]GES03447.1 hypothetical protein Acor_55130 [Acrocarpospora corrugata]
MKRAFAITEQEIQVPDEISGVDPIDSFSKLLIRCGMLENSLQGERRRADVAQRELLLGMLEVSDALDRIHRRTVEGASSPELLKLLSDGVAATRRLLLQKLARASVTPMRLAGMSPAPDLADIVGYVDHVHLPDETVFEQPVEGFMWRSDVLRRAHVVVVRHPTSETEPDEIGD